MKNYLLILILVLITINSFCQEKSEITPFVNPPETKPRFIEDIDLSESENLKSFNKKLRAYFYEDIITDSIQAKIYVSFKIDTLGHSQFHKIFPKEFETKYLKTKFSNIINSLPKFIPATQRNKKINMNYSITIFKNK